MSMLLKLFGVIVWIYFVLNGVSFLVREKGFDLIAYLFYPEQYLDIRVWDLTDAPYGASLFMGILYLSFPLYVCLRLWFDKRT